MKDILSEREKCNADLALKAAREGIVLLENNGVLPIKKGKIALFGAGARHTAKGGTGSGEVNNRHSICIEEGLEKCGATVTTKSWLDDCDNRFAEEEARRDEQIRKIGKSYSVFRFWDLMSAITLPYVFPAGREITAEDVAASDTDTAVYVLTRQAGEGADRRDKRGEYAPAEKELAHLKFLVAHYKNTVLVVNAGACIDMKELLALRPGAVIFMGQAGEAGGLALAQLMFGAYNFSGKLAASWPKNLSDLPCSDSYSYLDGNTDRELYKEGIFVGYRFYDTFGIEPQYAFGYGLSYTRFSATAKAELNGSHVTVRANVRNTGETEGSEVVQVYLSCPSGAVRREDQMLAAFAKTAPIAAGANEDVTASFDLRDFAAYDERRSCYILEKGNYVLRVGNSSRSTAAVATIVLDREYIVEQCKAIRGAQGRVREIEPPAAQPAATAGEVLRMAQDAIMTMTHEYGRKDVEVLKEVRRMSDRELSDLCVGDPAIMRGGLPDVVGAGGQIDKKVCKKYGFLPAVMADGPAGLRLTMRYAVEPNGKIRTGGKLPPDLVKAKKLFALVDRMWSKKSRRAKDVWQLCTAWPSATVQAQTFSPALVRAIGEATATEMQEYGVSIWLAPGMNIQRFPLCGRNFEYYSEDPLLTAEMASALTSGVQTNPHCAVTIKHYCCNNQEDNRMKSSSEINERALRELYLKAFRLTIRAAQPKCVMSSYNKVNGTYVNSSPELISDVLRGEFGHMGLVMTDWQSVAAGQADAGEVLAAQNDLIMAGDKYQHEQLFRALKSGKVKRSALEACASRILALCRALAR